jgi:hypothetical protein
VMFASKIAALTRAHNTGGTDMPDGIGWVGLVRMDVGGWPSRRKSAG